VSAVSDDSSQGAVIADQASLAGVLAEIAETTSETLELQQVFERIALAVRRLIPLDRMGVVRIVDDQRAVLHAISVLGDARGSCSQVECLQGAPLTSWSPRIRPRSGPIARIDDAETELDPGFPFDGRAIERGVRSILWEPFRTAETFGGVWLNASEPRAFTADHQEILRPIAALLGSAVEHWRIWDGERKRRERLDRVEALLGTLAESLDVREVFERLSAEMQPLVPHDRVNLTETDVRARTIRIVASAGPLDIPIRTDVFPLTEREVEEHLEFAIVGDILSELPSETERHRLIRASGLRSWLHVPVLLSGEIKGSLSFLHREPSRYSHDDAEVARRIADRIALTLSHRRLAEEARIAGEARERAERLEATVETLASELEARGRGRIVGVSPSWKEVLNQVGRVAPSETTVLITGESGTGKEIIARLLRQGSPRSGKPFVAVNCAALPEPLLESELFGHERGAFTGAVVRKIGRLEQAAGGTLFLDEITEMSTLLQAKLLRVLQEREFQRVGGTQVLRTDVRVLAATNRDPATAITQGRFREDLYYRLNVFEIHIPPLRDRIDDILPLAELFLDELGRGSGRPASGISEDARAWLLSYPWPGNVRELRNAVERAILLCDDSLITREHLPAAIGRSEAARRGNGAEASGLRLEEMERTFIERAMRAADGNKAKAARQLGLTRAQLYKRIEKYGLDARLGRARSEA
jgi:transcriptional regulator with GAF, ATPase, and Fis domain